MTTTERRTLSRIRAEAGRAGAAKRWGDRRDDRATACLRCYPADAERIRTLARQRGQLPADILAALLTSAGDF